MTQKQWKNYLNNMPQDKGIPTSIKNIYAENNVNVQAKLNRTNFQRIRKEKK